MAGAPQVGYVENGYKFAGGDPNNAASWQRLAGDQYLQSLPQDQQAMVKGLVSGDIQPPTNYAMKLPYWQNMISSAARYDPSFSETVWPTRVKMRVDAHTGKMGQQINALNTALQHANVLYNDIGGTTSTSFTPYNWVANEASQMFGDPGPTNYDNASSALGHELRRVYAQVGAGSQADLDKFDENMSRNGSREQKVGALRTQMQLLTGKLNAIWDQYRDAMGPNAPALSVVHPESVKALSNMGFKAEDLGIDPALLQNAAPQPSAPQRQPQPGYPPQQQQAVQRQPVPQPRPNNSAGSIPLRPGDAASLPLLAVPPNAMIRDRNGKAVPANERALSGWPRAVEDNRHRGPMSNPYGVKLPQGHIEDGYRYRGGDPAKPQSWELVR